MGASVGANRRRRGSDWGKGRIHDRVKGGGRNRRGRGGGSGRGIGRGRHQIFPSRGTEKAEDSETGGVGLAQEGGVGGAIVSRIWLGAHVVHRVG